MSKFNLLAFIGASLITERREKKQAEKEQKRAAMQQRHANKQIVSPPEEHCQKMYQSYRRLIEQSNVRAEINESDLEDLFRTLILYGICEIAMTVGATREKQIQMAEDIMNLYSFSFPMSGRKWIQGIYDRDPDVIDWWYMFCGDSMVLGSFWTTLQIMASQANSEENTSIFLPEYYQMLFSVEVYFSMEYGNGECNQVARDYYKGLLEAMIADSGRGEEDGE